MTRDKKKGKGKPKIPYFGPLSKCRRSQLQVYYSGIQNLDNRSPTGTRSLAAAIVLAESDPGASRSRLQVAAALAIVQLPCLSLPWPLCFVVAVCARWCVMLAGGGNGLAPMAALAVVLPVQRHVIDCAVHWGAFL